MRLLRIIRTMIRTATLQRLLGGTALAALAIGFVAVAMGRFSGRGSGPPPRPTVTIPVGGDSSVEILPGQYSSRRIQAPRPGLYLDGPGRCGGGREPELRCPGIRRRRILGMAEIASRRIDAIGRGIVMESAPHPGRSRAVSPRRPQPGPRRHAAHQYPQRKGHLPLASRPGRNFLVAPSVKVVALGPGAGRSRAGTPLPKGAHAAYYRRLLHFRLRGTA